MAGVVGRAEGSFRHRSNSLQSQVKKISIKATPLSRLFIVAAVIVVVVVVIVVAAIVLLTLFEVLFVAAIHQHLQHRRRPSSPSYLQQTRYDEEMVEWTTQVEEQSEARRALVSLWLPQCDKCGHKCSYCYSQKVALVDMTPDVVPGVQ